MHLREHVGGVCNPVAVRVEGCDAARDGEDLDDAAVFRRDPGGALSNRQNPAGTRVPTGMPRKFSRYTGTAWLKLTVRAPAITASSMLSSTA